MIEAAKDNNRKLEKEQYREREEKGKELREMTSEQLLQISEQERSEIESNKMEIREVNNVLVNEIRRLGQKRKEHGLSEDETEVMQVLIDVRTGLKKKEIKEVEEVDYNKKMTEVLEQDQILSLDSKRQFQDEYSRLPNSFKDGYFKNARNSILKGSEIMRVVGMKGIVFEMSRINKVIEQGREELYSSKEKFNVKYNAFPDTLNEFSLDEATLEGMSSKMQKKLEKFYDRRGNEWMLKSGVGKGRIRSLFKKSEMSEVLLSSFKTGEIPSESRTGEVDIDVPVKRMDSEGNEISYIYETKAYPRRLYGGTIDNYNQLLKYNEAVNKELVDGASVEVTGRVDPRFIGWAVGRSVDDMGAIPNVEMIYSMPLPSGQEYRFVLKGSKKDNGVDFENDDSEYSSEDKKVIAGIQKGIIDKSIIDILSGIREEDYDENIRELVKNPAMIDDPGTFENYEKQRLVSMWTQFEERAKEEKINVDNRRNVYEEDFSEDVVRKFIEGYQNYLKQNPEMAKVKKTYIVKENKIPILVNKMFEMIDDIKSFELERQGSEEEIERQKVREDLGYKGSGEGVALDIDHVMMDAIQEVNRSGKKRGRSYEKPERFDSLAEVMEKLESRKPSRVVEINVLDPLSKKGKRKGEITEKKGMKQTEKLKSDLIKDNADRLSKIFDMVNEVLKEGEDTVAVNGKLEYYEKVVNELLKNPKKLEKAMRFGRKKIEKLNNKLVEIEQEKTKVMKEMKKKAQETRDFSRVQETSKEFTDRVSVVREEMIESYVRALGGKEFYTKNIERRVLKIIDVEQVKYIYVVKADGSIILDEEKRVAAMSGRAAHSELAQGRNIYGAGEIVFEKHSREFADFKDWQAWNEDYGDNMEDLPWDLSEINNGSGHYRPSVETLPYVESLVNEVAAEKGMDVSQVDLVDSIMRGVKLKDSGVFV